MTDKLQQCYNLLRENADFAQYPLAQEIVFSQIANSVVWGSMFAILAGISILMIRWLGRQKPNSEDEGATLAAIFWIALIAFFWSGYKVFCQAQIGLQASVAPRTVILEYVEKAESEL